ncbi:MAG: ABC-F family ATP-binding cassette domain-containing protein [Lachnospiraceae bacterium]|nr:ABC-F family ATP-binding cassette domain-containing protein [Lachnospiraceae bacterium]
MAQIQVTDLTFSYDGSADDVLQNVSFSIDTNWKLGLIGRNGKGKTTLLQLFMGKYDYRGSITTGTCFDYFPYPVSEAELKQCAVDLLEKWKPRIELWQALIQMSELQMDPECLYRPFETLSFGERAGVMLAVLFAAENEFLLVDEPTNHLDSSARDIVKAYLASKKGFILVSHDRDLLDHVCDHVLVLNRSSIEVQTGNFSSWWENKEKKDAFRLAENEKHLKEISKLKAAADRNSRWADQNENSKIGFDPVREHDRSISSRSFIGAKTKKMQARVKSYEQRIDREIEEKEGLLAASLITPAHLYIWDEPLNYIDVFSRMQIEKLILQYEPTMLLVEHDVRFQEKVGTDVIKIQ